MSKPEREIRYLHRHRFRGVQEWTCPYCGAVNKEIDTSGRVFAFACQGVVRYSSGNRTLCGARLLFSTLSHTIPGGRLSPPPDVVIPQGLQEAFPQGELLPGLWRSGRACNIVVVSEADLAEQIRETVMSTAWRWEQIEDARVKGRGGRP